MRNLITLLLLAFFGVLCLQAQETSGCTKKYATIANYAVERDSMQQKQDWIASIALNQINESDTSKLAIAAKSYRLSVSYAMQGNKDTAFHYLNMFLDYSIADYMVVVDPFLNPLRDDTARWKSVITRVEQGYLACLDSSVNKEYALQLFYLCIEDQKYRYYYPVFGLGYDNGWDDYRTDTVFDQLVKRYGFPTISLVGPHAAKAGSAIVQHTTFSKSYKSRYKEVVKAYKNNDYDPKYYARVVDRWLLHHHRKQLYGTNWLKSTEKRFVKKYGDHFILEPVRNFEKLNERRAALGMEPIEEYVKHFPDYMIPEKYYRKRR